MPSDFELKVRFSHAPDTDSDGSSAARACRTRASASLVRNVASATTGTSPDASRTASANDKRIDAGVCPVRVMGATTSHATTVTSRRLLICDTMEIQVDVGVEVLLDVEPLRHARCEGPPRDDRVNQRRHGELRGNHDVHRTELSVLDAALDHACHQAVPAGHDFLVVETRQL